MFAFSGRGLGAQVNTGDGRSWDSERVCFIDYPAKFMFILFNLLSLPSDSYAHRRTPAQTCRTGPVFVLDILGMSPERGAFPVGCIPDFDIGADLKVRYGEINPDWEENCGVERGQRAQIKLRTQLK